MKMGGGHLLEGLEVLGCWDGGREESLRFLKFDV